MILQKNENEVFKLHVYVKRLFLSARGIKFQRRAAVSGEQKQNSWTFSFTVLTPTFMAPATVDKKWGELLWQLPLFIKADRCLKMQPVDDVVSFLTLTSLPGSHQWQQSFVLCFADEMKWVWM